MTYELAHPWMLLALVPLLALAAWRWVLRERARPALRVPGLGALAELPASLRLRLRPLGGALWGLALLLLVVAIARPRGGEALETITSEGIDIMLAIDTSGSMLAEDMASASGQRVNRLQAAKEVTAAFVGRRSADRIGLVSFDDVTVPRCPLTLDYGILLDLLAEVEVEDQAARTALGTALASAVNRLRSSESSSKLVVLVTDGRNNAGRIEPSDAAQLARLYGVRVYTVGIGSTGEAPFPVRGPFGSRGYQMVSSDLDEETLRAIAEATDGHFFRAAHRGSLDRIFELIDELERTEVEIEHHVRHHEYFPLILRAAAVALVFVALLGATWWRTFP